MSVTTTAWDRAALAARRDDVLDVYAAAMEVDRVAARARRGILTTHLDRPGLRAVAAEQDGELVGIAYGYLGARGQWWHDQVRGAMGEQLAAAWLDGSFEVCELHVLPRLHGTGLGRTLLQQLLAAADAPTAVLTTPDVDTRARRFYRAGGWCDLVRDLRFPGDPRAFAVLGLRLPRPSPGPSVD